MKSDGDAISPRVMILMSGVRINIFCRRNPIPSIVCPVPRLVDHPDRPGRHALRLRYVKNDHLEFDVEEATWNFPAAKSGELSVRLKPQPGNEGIKTIITF